MTLLLLAVGCAGGDAKDPLQSLPTVASGPGGNGVDMLPPKEALNAAREALESVSSFRVEGSSLSGGPINLAFAQDTGSTGSVSAGGSAVQLVAIDGKVYVKGDDALIAQRVGADAAKTLSGKWLLLRSGSTGGFGIFADGGRFAAELLNPPGVVERTKVATVDGQLALGLVFVETGERVWVAIRGQALPIRFEEKGASGDQGVLRFVDYGRPVQITEPAPAQVVDAATLPPMTAPPSPSPAG